MSEALVWYIARHGHQHGPYSDQDFQRLISQSAIHPADYIWQPGFPDWVRYSELQAARHPEKPSQRNDAEVVTPPRAKLSGMAVSLIKAPLRLISTFYKIIQSPSRFALENVDSGSRSLRRAIFFYLNVFVILFLVGDLASRLNFYTGESEPRALVLLLLQLIVAIPAMYFINQLCGQKPTFTGLTEAILYIDAVFLTFFTVIGISAAIPHYLGSSPKTDVDIITTEFERCLAEKSWPYWLLRGDITFYLEAYSTQSAVRLKEAIDYAQFVIVLPFCLMLGFMMKARFGSSLVINAIAGAVVFFGVVNGLDLCVDKVLQYATADPTCQKSLPTRIRARYSAALISESVAARLNATISAQLTSKQTWVVGTPETQTVDVILRPQPSLEEDQALASKFLKMHKELYCTDGAALSLAKYMGLSLVTVVRSSTGSVLAAETITANECSLAQ